MPQTRDQLRRRRARVARVNMKRPRMRVIVSDGEADDGWARVAAVLLDLLDTPPTPGDGRAR